MIFHDACTSPEVFAKHTPNQQIWTCWEFELEIQVRHIYFLAGKHDAPSALNSKTNYIFLSWTHLKQILRSTEPKNWNVRKYHMFESPKLIHILPHLEMTWDTSFRQFTETSYKMGPYQL